MRRLTFSLLFVAVAAILGLGWAIDQWYNHQVKAQENPVISHYRAIGKHIVELIELTHVDEQTLSTWAAQSNAQVQFTAYEEFPLPPDLKVAFEQGEPLLLDSDTAISLHYFIASRNAVISLRFPNEGNYQQSPLSWLLTILFYVGVVAVLLLWLLPLLNRLRLLRNSAQAFGAGDLTARIPRARISYIADIEHDFNRMAQKIENLIHDNKLLSRGLSHDLRTPLARLRFGLDVLEEANLNGEQQKTLAHLNRDLSAMESLVETLLSYARLEQGNIALSFKPVDVIAFLLSIKNEFYQDEIVLRIESFSQTLIIRADENYLAMLMHNLIQNALRHGNGVVWVSVSLHNGNVNVIVEDDGKGIPATEREHVLKPFYRVPSSSHTQGHGMGLAIVDRVVQWHGAELALSNSERLGGLSVCVSFSCFVSH